MCMRACALLLFALSENKENVLQYLRRGILINVITANYRKTRWFYYCGLAAMIQRINGYERYRRVSRDASCPTLCPRCDQLIVITLKRSLAGRENANRLRAAWRLVSRGAHKCQPLQRWCPGRTMLRAIKRH